MLMNGIKMEDWKLLSFLALLSDYDYFSIQKADEPVFHTTGIERSCGWVLKFNRKFATPVYSDGELAYVVALSETEFDCQIGMFTYHIHALHKKPKAIPIRSKRNWRSVMDVADIEYINIEKSQYIKELDLLVLVVDPYKLGELTAIEETQIKRIINTQLNGNGIAMQMCRSICFECRLHDVNQIIYAGMYDLENAVPVSSVMFYNKNLSHSMTDKSVQRCESLWRLANMIYSKKFS